MTVLPRLAALLPELQRTAPERDAAATFPATELAALRAAGVLDLPLPMEQPDAAEPLADQLATALVRVGEASLSLGRIVEAHVNTRHLLARYGTPAQQAAARQALGQGALFALWVTDPFGEAGLRMRRDAGGIVLSGRKQFCSAAGFATHALVTATDPDGAIRMLVVPVTESVQVTPLEAPLQGMRAAVTGAVQFTDLRVSPDTELGQAGDYLREPDFSAGAWRGSAVALGGLRALLAQAVAQLRAAGRTDDPHQRARLGQAMIATETSRLWLRTTARRAEVPGSDAAGVVAAVGLARIAIESACLDALRLVQRSLGLAAFRRGNPVELIGRDLATYLRQPAPDQTLTEAAAFFAAQPEPTWAC
jgi:alkylation response protein AidB-like acyl-CoA dehydrogenase